MNSIFSTMRSQLSESFASAVQNVIEILPQAALAILIVGVGLLAAAGLYFATVRILNFFAIDKLAGKTPLSRVLKNIGISKTISEIVALLVFWMCIFLTLVLAAEVLKLNQLSIALGVITRFIPQLIIALLFVVFGMLFARFLETLVAQTLGKAHIKFSNSIGKAVYTVVLIFVFLLVFEQLGFNLRFLTTNVIILLSILVLIGGIGFMISARIVLENAMAAYQIRNVIKLGSDITIGEVHGKVRGFSTTSIILNNGHQDIVIPASTLLANTYSVKV